MYKRQALDKEIEDTQKQLRDMQGDKAMIKEEVDAEDIADVVSRWTGIPVSKMPVSYTHLDVYKRQVYPHVGRSSQLSDIHPSETLWQEPATKHASFIL